MPPHNEPTLHLPKTTPPNPATEPIDGAAGERINDVPLYSKRRVVIPAALIVLAALTWIWYWNVNLGDHVSTDDAFVDHERVSISSKILGRVVTLAAGEGTGRSTMISNRRLSIPNYEESGLVRT